MSDLNYQFFDEFKALDNLCRDIYGQSIENKLGVTLYLEDMNRQAYQGASKISGWTSDYNKLKSARNMRNELAHSRNSFSADICTQENIDFIRSFRARILNQTDPLALLRKQSPHSQPQTSFTYSSIQQPQQTGTYTSPRKATVGCFGIASLFLIIFACILVAFFL